MKDLNKWEKGEIVSADMSIEDVHKFKPDQEDAVLCEGQYLLQIPEGFKAIVKIEQIDG